MFKYRIISFPLLLALLYALFFWQYGWLLFIPGAAFVVGLLLYEAGKLFNLMKLENDPVFAAELGGIVAFLVFLCFGLHYKTGIFSLLFIGVILVGVMMVWSSLLFCKDETVFRKLFTSAALAAILGFPYILFFCFYFNGTYPFLLLYLILTVKAMDTGGYVFGMLSGKLLPGGNHKIAPSISPKKSWEGFFGGMALSIAVSWALCHFFCRMPWFVWLAGGILFSLLSFAGDLTESALKRRAGVKDSAEWIPGMGGVFDVLDSFLYVGPAAGLIALISLIFF